MKKAIVFIFIVIFTMVIVEAQQLTFSHSGKNSYTLNGFYDELNNVTEEPKVHYLTENKMITVVETESYISVMLVRKQLGVFESIIMIATHEENIEYRFTEKYFDTVFQVAKEVEPEEQTYDIKSKLTRKVYVMSYRGSFTTFVF